MSINPTAFLRLLGDAVMPAPDDPGPWGPGGPVLSSAIRDLFRSGATRHLPPLVTQANAAYILAVATEDPKQAEAWMAEIVDDWCGTRPPRIKFPPIPWPVPDPDPPRPWLVDSAKMSITTSDYLAAAIVYQRVSDELGDSPLAQDAADLAERFLAFANDQT